jgi:hypothetical protein
MAAAPIFITSSGSRSGRFNPDEWRVVCGPKQHDGVQYCSLEPRQWQGPKQPTDVGGNFFLAIVFIAAFIVLVAGAGGLIFEQERKEEMKKGRV